MRLSEDQVRALAARAVALTHADEAEAVVMANDAALTRFANNRIHQNVAEENTTVSVRAVLGTRTGVASTNRLDDDALAACCEAAVAAARVAPEDPAFPGLPAPAPIERIERVCASTQAFDAEARAHAAASIIEQSKVRGLSAAGTVARVDYAVGIANSRGIDAAMAVTDVKATVLSTGTDGGSGWASWLGCDASRFAPEALGDEAATLAQRSEVPGSLDPGAYAVVLAPEAVSDVLDFLGYLGFGAQAVDEKSSFIAGHEGERLLSELITLTDNALSAETVGLTFDFEGCPKRRTPLVEAGVVRGPVTDSYWAAKLGVPNSGHALPAPNPYGPLPMNLELAAGETRVDEMIASVERGLYITRFHYVNVEDPVRAVLTGMTRDGTFLIEGGRLTQPVKNVRFTQSAVDALANVEAVGDRRVLVGPEEGGANLTPTLLIGSWQVTGQTR
ncbi:MAG: TldD/PmbA family protein [Actinobacteria bacterium]|nr:MAG: TldD/PmbA family protein [Actinomycetota bacterium]